MKYRLGHVSNSSSANYIIDHSYESVFDLAIAMLNIRNTDYDDWTEAERKRELPEIDNINKARRNKFDPDTAVYFSTCNYDTFIKKVSGFYIVTTCNNHPFAHELDGIITEGVVSHFPASVKRWLDDRGYLRDDDTPLLPFAEEIDTWKFQIGETFWSPKYDLELSRYDYMKAQREGNKDAKAYCSNKGHFSDMMVLASTGKVVCPECYSKEIEKNDPGIENRFDILDL